jgi:L-iditol 2-dehydrogenase
MLNPSAVLYGPHDVRIEDRPVPEPASGQVLVEIAAVGICGSDVPTTSTVVSATMWYAIR